VILLGASACAARPVPPPEPPPKQAHKEETKERTRVPHVAPPPAYGNKVVLETPATPTTTAASGASSVTF